jgi:poly-D-alanine transfer protein DltD
MKKGIILLIAFLLACLFFLLPKERFQRVKQEEKKEEAYSPSLYERFKIERDEEQLLRRRRLLKEERYEDRKKSRQYDRRYKQK